MNDLTEPTDLAVVEHEELSGSFIRVVPSATSLFNVSRLNVTRNNVRELNQGNMLTQRFTGYFSWILISKAL